MLYSDRNASHLCHGNSDTQDAISIVVNKQVKDKILAKKSNIHIEYNKHSKSRDVFLHKCRKMIQKKEAKKEETWVQLKCQPAVLKTAKQHIV